MLRGFRFTTNTTADLTAVGLEGSLVTTTGIPYQCCTKLQALTGMTHRCKSSSGTDLPSDSSPTWIVLLLSVPLKLFQPSFFFEELVVTNRV
jgi:hypothetical protein